MGMQTLRFGLLGFLGLAAVAAFAPRGAAQDAPTPTPAPTPAPAPDVPGELDLVVGEGITPRDLLVATQRATGIPIFWSDGDKAIVARKIQGPTRLRIVRDVFETVRDLLVAQEIVLVPVGAPPHPSYVAMDARTLANQFILKASPTPIVLDDESVARLEGRSGLFVTATLRVNSANLRDVRTVLARLVTGQNIGSVQELPELGAIVITDFAPSVVQIYRLVQQLNAAKPLAPPAAPVSAGDDAFAVYRFASSDAAGAALRALRELFPPASAAKDGAPAVSGARFGQPATDSGTPLGTAVLARATVGTLRLVDRAVGALGGRLDPDASSPR